MNVEELIFEPRLPTNTVAILERFKEVLKENNTNTLQECKDIRARMLLWLLNVEIYGDLGHVDMSKEYQRLYNEFKRKR